MMRAQLLRASAPLSPLPPATYHAFSSHLTTALNSGDYLKSSAESEKAKDAAGDTNPLDLPGMDGAMEGMKKQAVMMCDLCHPSAIARLTTQGAEHGVDAVHLGLLLRLHSQYILPC